MRLRDWVAIASHLMSLRVLGVLLVGLPVLAQAHAIDYLLPIPTLTAIQPNMGWYAQAEIGKSHSEHSLQDVAVTTTTTVPPLWLVESGKVDDENPAYRFALGYFVNQFIAFECGIGEQSRVEFTKLDYGAVSGGEPISGQRVTIDKVVVDLFLKLLYPMSDQISLYVRGGVAQVRADISDNIQITDSETVKAFGGDINKTAFTYGVGAQVMVRDAVMLFVNWVRMEKAGVLEETDTASIGIAYFYG